MKSATRRICAILALMAVSAALFAQAESAATDFLNTAESTIGTAARTIVNIVSVIIGLVGIVMLGINGYKYMNNKGGQNDDALLKIGGGLVIIMILMQIIKMTLLKGI